MNTDANKTIDFEKKLKEKLGKELKKEIENGNYDEIIDYILSAYSEGLNIFYKEGVKSFFEEFAKTNDKKFTCNNRNIGFSKGNYNKFK